MKNTYIKKISISLFAFMGLSAFSQEIDANLQMRPRYEYRNGYKGLMPNNELPTSFVSQRTRLNFNFKEEKISAKLTFQNVRTWGDVKTTSTDDKNGVMLYEAWAQYNFNDYWSTRIGRQVLSYDNQRIFGEIDWAQQGQSHDALLVSYKKLNNQFDFGAALNSDTEALYRDLYTTNYKNMQFAWYNTRYGDAQVSLLALNTGFQYEDLITTDLEMDYMQTFGSFLKYNKNKWNADLGLYIQTGKNKLVTNNTSVSAYNLGLNLNYAFTETFNAGFGYEILSGKDQTDADDKIKSFNPIFGTNHAFNGFMDYFYVGNHKNTVGLQDLFFKFNYNKDKWQFGLTPHMFMTAADVIDPIVPTKTMDSYLGTEIDLTVKYALHKNFTVTGGYSQMFGTETLEVLKAGNKGNDNNWAWIMININPRIFTSSK